MWLVWNSYTSDQMHQHVLLDAKHSDNPLISKLCSYVENYYLKYLIKKKIYMKYNSSYSVYSSLYISTLTKLKDCENQPIVTHNYYNSSHKHEIVTRHCKLGYFKNNSIYIGSKFVKTLPFNIKGENNTETFKHKVNTI